MNNPFKIKLDGKYEKELPVRRQVIASYIPIFNIGVLMSLGWRYGSRLFAEWFTLYFGMYFLKYVIVGEIAKYPTEYHRYFYPNEYFFNMSTVDIQIYFWTLVLYGLITWSFIIKYNARVRSDKNLHGSTI